MGDLRGSTTELGTEVTEAAVLGGVVQDAGDAVGVYDLVVELNGSLE